jgi:ATP-binding cassette subfamily B multidrug efflux pump
MVLLFVFRRLARFYQPYILSLYLSLFLMGLYSAGLLITPYITEHIVNGLVHRLPLAALWTYLAALPAIALVAGVFGYLQQYVGQDFGQKCVFALRQALYRRLEAHDYAYYDTEHTGNLMQRLTGDVEAFRMFLTQGTRNAASVVYNFAFALIVMLSLSWQLTVISLAFVPILIYTAIRFDREIRPTYTAIRRAMSRMQTVVQESIMGVRTVKSFAREAYELATFEQVNETYRERNLLAVQKQARYQPFMQLVANLGAVALLAVGGYDVIHHTLSLGALVAFLGVLGFLVGPVQELGWLVNLYAQAGASETRLLEILDKPDHIYDLPEAVPLTPERARGHVTFEHVTVIYPGTTKPALEDVTFDAPPGTVVGILGRTGAGKSTLVNLIPRFYDPTSGVVRVDGEDVRHWTLASLRRQIGVVPNDTFLFSASIYENIAYGRPDATPDLVRRAAELAEAAEFIDELPDQYQTVVGERGLGLSGGQKQRIALARALLYDPKILILDDSTSSVDMETEYRIQKTLSSLMRQRTTFIIAHRISSIRRADLILVLDGGRIVERGRHEDLVRAGGLYQEIYEAQFRDRSRLAGSHLLRGEA